MDVNNRLSKLKRQILTQDAGDLAFETFENIKPELSPIQRVRILTTWNIYLRSGNKRPLIETIDEVKKSLSN
jgi:hypothetical protein